MNEELEFETYLNINPNKFEIYLYDTKNLINLYREEIILNENINSTDLNILKKFLDNNIFKIEKLSGKFVENIFIIIDSDKIFNLNIGIKKKNYNISINQTYLKNSLKEAKDLFNENYQNEKIMHMLINKYLINGNSYSSIEDNMECDNLSLEIQFKSLSENIVYDLNKLLENYQIKIVRFLDGEYIENFFKNEEKDFPEMIFKILKGCNQNEVMVVPKNHKKKAFFEKFFQLFG